jgi:hypothetical protein
LGISLSGIGIPSSVAISPSKAAGKDKEPMGINRFTQFSTKGRLKKSIIAAGIISNSSDESSVTSSQRPSSAISFRTSITSPPSPIISDLRKPQHQDPESSTQGTNNAATIPTARPANISAEEQKQPLTQKHRMSVDSDVEKNPNNTNPEDMDVSLNTGMQGKPASEKRVSRDSSRAQTLKPS